MSMLPLPAQHAQTCRTASAHAGPTQLRGRPPLWLPSMHVVHQQLLRTSVAASAARDLTGCVQPIKMDPAPVKAEASKEDTEVPAAPRPSELPSCPEPVNCCRRMVATTCPCACVHAGCTFGPVLTQTVLHCMLEAPSWRSNTHQLHTCRLDLSAKQHHRRLNLYRASSLTPPTLTVCIAELCVIHSH